MEKYESRLAVWVIEKRWLVISLALSMVLIAAIGVRNLYFTNNFRVFFSEENPNRLAYEALENTYTKDDNILIVLAPDDKNVFTKDNLQLIRDLTDKAWEVPFSTRVDSITNFQYSYADGDELSVHDLVEKDQLLDEQSLRKIREITLDEPLLFRRLISIDATVTAINVTVQMPRKNEIAEIPAAVSFARSMAEEIRQERPDIKVYLTGTLLLNNAFPESSQRDMKKLVPFSFAVMLILLAVIVGRFWGTLSTFLVIVSSILVAMGTAGHLGFPLSPPSALSPSIILTVTIANCVHILGSINFAMRRGSSKKKALQESVRVNAQPVLLACVTTAVGFLSMNFSDVPPFNHLGTIVGVGVLTSCYMSLCLLPALMSLFPLRPQQGERRGGQLIEKLADLVVRRRVILLWTTMVIVVLLIANIPRNELNDTFLHYFDDSIQFRVDSDYTTNNLTGLYYLGYSMESGESGGIHNPKFLAELEAFAQWFRQQPETIHVSSITDILKRLNKNMHGDDPNAYRLPVDRNLAAQYILLFEMSLPYGLDLNNQLNVDKSSTRLTVSVNTLSSQQLLALEERANDWLKENGSHIKITQATGTNIVFAKLGMHNIKSMLLGTTVALLIISFLLMIAFRSVKFGLISLIPNLVPAAMGFGLWGILVGQIGLSLSVVMAITMGIVVDDTVHFLSKYLRARREQNISSENAIRYAFKMVGPALITTSFLLVIGFSILATSSFYLNAGMGLLTAIVIVFALLADLLLLPAVLMKIEEMKNENTAFNHDHPVSGSV
ncbi:RND family transporter [Microbulbifer sp. 2205BS26-8]|uniref:efflux RND transporter permease subunit n=1 Tax=Microbulbifer sp. 2205BS26-8 TaxID=3064386 RepID=UPI00273E4071|nr:MMPL family transporter [Microbulbifer sp. 2205BS26-8]MDP5210668.1 MMPL family transporter [Microbulbifer sp. 2205BS26-8]